MLFKAAFKKLYAVSASDLKTQGNRTAEVLTLTESSAHATVPQFSIFPMELAKHRRVL